MFSSIKKVNWGKKHKILKKLMQLSCIHLENKQSFEEKMWKIKQDFIDTYSYEIFYVGKVIQLLRWQRKFSNSEK